MVRLAGNYCLLAATPEAAGDAFTQATAALTAEGLAPNARKSRIRGHANPEDLFLLEGQEPDPVSDMWLLVPGGQCRYRDNARPVGIAPLLWTATPVTPHYLGEPGSGVPVTRVSHKDAAAIARALGGRLPRSAEWEWMAAGAGRRRYP